MKNRILIIGVMLFSLILSSCGATEKANFPIGRFIKSGEENYGMKFNADETFSVFRGETIYVAGTYKADGKVFTETSNDGGCETNVSFNYTFDGSNLTFTYVGDPEKDSGCTGRYGDFNNVTYILSK